MSLADCTRRWPATTRWPWLLTRHRPANGSKIDAVEGRIDSLENHLDDWKREIVHEFKVVAEDLRHDFRGAFQDKLAAHDDRLDRIEKHLGLRAA